MSADLYYTIEETSVAEFKDRGSKFIAHAFPISSREDFKQLLAGLKKEHPKAAHHCFAYRLGTEGINHRVSDDGEPSGTAGRPILGQIDSKQLTNVLVVVVRYFGGTLLGVPGLINAYKTATALALNTRIVQKAVLINYSLEFDYTKMNEVMRVVKQFDLLVIKNEMQLFCVLVTGIPKAGLENALFQLNQITGIIIKKEE